MHIRPTDIHGVSQPEQRVDERGYFESTLGSEEFARAGPHTTLPQNNQSP
jgi:dTDP-4-dehydrorhamnose 3,5-epimerase-like enzyme